MAEALIRIRMSEHDAHYAGGLVNGSRMLDLFGDVATELLIINDGDEGLFVAYRNVEFKAPVYAGDFIEASGRIVKVGNSSRTMEFIAKKVISLDADGNHESSAKVLIEPVIVCIASGTCVVQKEKQRGQQHG
jgi:3-aminobutyryl-CoA ammonia-lyase